jgi:7-cyano-7-deazaguanine synthase
MITPIGTSSVRRAVILLSGGVDSSTVLAMARAEGYECHALSFEYGQRHGVELEAARRVAAALGAASHTIVPVGLGLIGGSALTADMEVPKTGTPKGTIPVTYVPARNTVFLSLGLALAETLGAWDVFIGANAVDYSGYPDCRPEYIEAFERMANLATKAAVEGSGRFRIHAPLIHMTKAAIIRSGRALGLDYSLTWSCYDPTPDGSPCGLCDSCRIRIRGFEDAGLQE